MTPMARNGQRRDLNSENALFIYSTTRGAGSRLGPRDFTTIRGSLELICLSPEELLHPKALGDLSTNRKGTAHLHTRVDPGLANPLQQWI